MGDERTDFRSLFILQLVESLFIYRISKRFSFQGESPRIGNYREREKDDKFLFRKTTPFFVILTRITVSTYKQVDAKLLWDKLLHNQPSLGYPGSEVCSRVRRASFVSRRHVFGQVPKTRRGKPREKRSLKKT